MHDACQQYGNCIGTACLHQQTKKSIVHIIVISDLELQTACFVCMALHDIVAVHFTLEICPACYYTLCSMLKEGLQMQQVLVLDVKNIGSMLQDARVLIYGQQAALGFDGLSHIRQLVWLSVPTCCPLRQSIGRHERPASRYLFWHSQAASF